MLKQKKDWWDIHYILKKSSIFQTIPDINSVEFFKKILTWLFFPQTPCPKAMLNVCGLTPEWFFSKAGPHTTTLPRGTGSDRHLRPKITPNTAGGPAAEVCLLKHQFYVIKSAKGQN